MTTPAPTTPVPAGRVAADREPTESDKRALAEALAALLARLAVPAVPSAQDKAA